MQKTLNKNQAKKSETTEKNPRSERGAKLRKKSTLKTVFVVLALPIWVSLTLIFSQYFIGFGAYFILGRETLSTPVWTTVVNALIYAFSLFLTIFIPIKLFKKWKTDKKELGLTGLPTWTDLGILVAGFIAYLILAMLLVSIFSAFPFFDANETQELGYNYLSSGLDRLVAFFALCIVAPVAEEIIFRGWLYGKLRAKIPGEKLSLFLSIFLTSLTFAILHGQWNVGVNVFAMSIVLCAMREITGTIHSGILLHIVKNSVAFILVYIVGMS